MPTPSSTRVASSLTLLVLAACGEAYEFGDTVAAIAPAGSDATFLSNTFPSDFAPGERVNVEVVVRNDGANTPANDWLVGAVRLIPTNNTFSVPPATLAATTVVGDTATFRFVVTAPNVPTTAFQTQLYYAAPPDVGYFGPWLTFSNIPVQNAQRRWSCGLVSTDLPTTMTPGERRTVSVTVQNTGTNTWLANDHCLLAQDATPGLWGAKNCPVLDADVPPGGTHTFSFLVDAPTVSGPYDFTRQMSQLGSIASGSVRVFDATNGCIDQQVLVGMGTAPIYDAQFIAAESTIDEATPLLPGETVAVDVTYENTGDQTWTADDFFLVTRNLPADLWGPRTVHGVAYDVAPGQRYTFTFSITAPAAPGAYTHAWRMLGRAPAPGYFGERIDLPVTVSTLAQPANAADVLSTNVPSSLHVQENAQFSVTMKNEGTRTWSAAEGYALGAAHTPSGLWGLALHPLPAGVTVAPGQTHTFVFNVRAPSGAGTYATQWRMFQSPSAGGPGLFGDASNDLVTVTPLAPPPDAGVPPDSGVPPDAGIAAHPITLLGPWDSYSVSDGSALNTCPMPQSGSASCTIWVTEGAWFEAFGLLPGQCYRDTGWVACSQGSALNLCNTYPLSHTHCESYGVDGPATFVHSVRYDGAFSACGPPPTMCLPGQVCGSHGTAYCGACPTAGDVCVQDHFDTFCVAPTTCP